MNLLLLALALYLAGAVGAVVLRGSSARWLVATTAACGACAAAAAALPVILTGRSLTLAFASSVASLSLVLHLDPLGAFFVILLGVVAAPAAVYGAGYDASHTPARSASAMLPLFLLSMTLVPLAGNVFTFLFAWEGMALASYFLVIGEGDSPERLAAGRWYTGMAHAGFAMIAAAFFLLMERSGGADFATIRTLGGSIGAGRANAIFLLALLGFGSKAGLVPLHVWLPKAHPAAPSHISALMSGAMLPLGVYGFLRVVLDLLGGGPSWWGILLLVLGALSALKGALYALVEQDLKRLLAFSSVENLGVVFMGLGIGLIFHGEGLGEPCALALGAALYHALNHAAFKGLLFFGAGAVQQAAGTRNLEAMGGLIKKMPQTAACFLVGAAAIAALPPLNGFVSEWMIFQALVAGARLPEPLMAALMGLAVGALALTGGLAAACFVKAFGIPFLAMPRSRGAEQAREVSLPMRAAMFLLAGACVLLGLLPAAVTPLLARALQGLPGLDLRGAVFRLGLEMEAPGGASRISPPLLALALAMAIVAIIAGLRLFKADRRLRVGDTWGCGRVALTPRMEYTSMAFAEPLRRVFAGLYRPSKDLTIGFHPDSKYFVRSMAYRSRIRSWFEESVYRTLFEMIRPLSEIGRRLHSGSVHLYLSYIVAALLLLLLLERWL